jgi:molybdopterin/thiamine biosynthesis adenylyltransferase
MAENLLTPREIRRYSKQIMLPEIGVGGQEMLKKAKVLVVGAGGLGCPVLQYLTSAGVGKITIIEFDKVDETNLQRQVLYGSNDNCKKPT